MIIYDSLILSLLLYVIITRRSGKLQRARFQLYRSKPPGESLPVMPGSQPGTWGPWCGPRPPRSRRQRLTSAPIWVKNCIFEKCIFEKCVIEKCIFEKCIFRNFCKFLAGSFSAVSKRNFARKYAFDSIFQALQDLHTFAPLQSQNFSKKSK